MKEAGKATPSSLEQKPCISCSIHWPLAFGAALPSYWNNCSVSLVRASVDDILPGLLSSLSYSVTSKYFSCINFHLYI